MSAVVQRIRPSARGRRRRDQRDLVGSAAALVSVVAMGTSFPALAELSGYPIATSQALRYVVGALLLLALMRGRPAIPGRRDLPLLAVLAAVGLVLFNVLLLAAVRTTDPGTVGVVVGALPILVALLAPLAARRRPQRAVVACAAVAVVGAALVQGAGGRVTAAGIGFAVGALVCEVLFIVLVDALVRTLGALGLSFWTCVLSIPMLLLGGAAVDGAAIVRLPSVGEALAIVYLGVMVSTLALVLWSVGIARLGSERFGLFTGATPVAGLLASAVLGLSTLTPLRLAGCVVVAGAIMVGSAVEVDPPDAPQGV